MKNVQVTFQPQVTLSLTADDWQLYRLDGGRDKAAEGLNFAVADAINHCDNWKDAHIHATRVLDEYSHFGAADTESQSVLIEILFAAYPSPR